MSLAVNFRRIVKINFKKKSLEDINKNLRNKVQFL